MGFGISKCAHVTMKVGGMKAVVSVSGKELSSGKLIPELESDIDYKYIGILEVNDIMHIEVKDEIQKKYFWRVRQRHH